MGSSVERLPAHASGEAATEARSSAGKHTPGPWSTGSSEWTADNDGENTYVAILADNREDPVCLVVEGAAYGRDHTLDANAALIAAAPDGLAFAQALGAFWTEDFPEGPDGNPKVWGGLGTITEETLALWRQCRAFIAKATGQ